MNSGEAVLQRHQALSLANEIRQARSRLKTDLKLRRRSIHELFEQPPWYAADMTIIAVLRALPGLGATKAERTLKRAGVSESRTLGDLSDHQRERLRAALEAYR